MWKRPKPKGTPNTFGALALPPMLPSVPSEISLLPSRAHLVFDLCGWGVDRRIASSRTRIVTRWSPVSDWDLAGKDARLVTWNRGMRSHSPPIMNGDQMPSLPDRKRRQMPGVCPGGMFKLRFEWYIIFRDFSLPNSGKDSHPSHCIPSHISMVGPGIDPTGKPMRCW